MLKKIYLYISLPIILVLTLVIILLSVNNNSDSDKYNDFIENEYQYAEASVSIGDVSKTLTVKSQAYSDETYYKTYTVNDTNLLVDVNDIVNKGDKISLNGSDTFDTFGRVISINSTSSGEVITISDLSKFSANLKISEEYVSYINIGSSVEISYNDLTIDGEIFSHNYLIEDGYLNTIIKFENNNILEGSTINAKIILDERENVLTIPNEALIVEGNNYFVNIIDNNIISKTEVDIGLIGDSLTEIKRGVSIDDTIVIDMYE